MCLTLAMSGLAACSPDAAPAPTSGSRSASSTPLTLVEPSPDASVGRACKAVMSALPTTVDGLARDQLTRYTAEWGGSTVTLRCGVERPAALAQDSRCDEVNAVGWFTEQSDAGYTFTTIGRRGYVEVRVSADHQPAANALVDLSASVSRMPVVHPCV